MPVHDWTRVSSGDFHDFHQSWVVQLRSSLNHGALPPGYSAMVQRYRAPVEPPRGSEVVWYTSRKNQVAIFRGERTSPVAVIRLVAPGDKLGVLEVNRFADELLVAIDTGVHALVVDLFPPSAHDPNGIHGAVCEAISDTYRLPAVGVRTQVAYRSGEPLQAYVETFNVGDELASMPLFLNSDDFIHVPLAETYRAAFAGIPSHVQRSLQQTSPN